MELAAKLFGVSRFTAVVILVTGLLLITGCADFTVGNNSPQNNSAGVAYNERKSPPLWPFDDSTPVP